MKFLNIFRLFRGYVRVKAEGGFSDKFLNDLKIHGINAFDVERSSMGVCLSVFAEDFRLIHAFRRNSSMRLKILEKRGLPFVLYRRKNRTGVLFGLALGLLIVYYFSGSLLTISVEGVDTLNENKVREVFQKNGVFIGARVDDIDPQTVCDYAVLDLPEYSWVSFSRSGTNGVIKVREAVPVPEVESHIKPRNVIAKYDGQIVKIEPFSGKEEVKVGSAVVKGDLLISGAVDLTSGITTLHAAEGNVIAKTKRDIVSEFSSDSSLFKRMNRKGYTTLLFLGKRIGFGRGENAYESYFEYDGILIPVGLASSFRYKEKRVELPREEEYLLCLNDLFQKQEENMKNEDIQSVKVKYEFSEEETIITASYTLLEDICDYSYINVE